MVLKKARGIASGTNKDTATSPKSMYPFLTYSQLGLPVRHKVAKCSQLFVRMLYGFK